MLRVRSQEEENGWRRLLGKSDLSRLSSSAGGGARETQPDARSNRIRRVRRRVLESWIRLGQWHSSWWKVKASI